MKPLKFLRSHRGVQRNILVIIAAVIVVAAVATAGFMLGWFGGAPKTPEAITIVVSQSRLDETDAFANITLQNTGTTDVKIVSARIGTRSWTNQAHFQTVYANGTATTPDDTVPAGQTVKLNIPVGGGAAAICRAGQSFLVEVGTQAGNTFTATIIAQT